MKLSPPLRMSEVAEMLGAGWSVKRVRSWLQRLQASTGIRLLEGGGRAPFLVTRAALRRAAPDLFDDVAGLSERVEELEALAREQEARLMAAATAIGSLRAAQRPPASSVALRRPSATRTHTKAA